MSISAKNSIIYFLQSLASPLLALISLPIFTRILLPIDFGALALCQVYSVFIIGISNFGLSLGYERDFFEFKDQKKQIVLMYSIILFITLTSLIFAILSYLYIEKIIYILNISIQNSKELLLVCFLCAFLINIKSYFMLFFKNTESAREYSLFAVLEVFMTFIFSLILILIFKTGIIGIVLGQVFSITILLFFLVIKFFKIKSFEIDFNSLKKSIILSVPLTPRIFFGIIGSQFDKFIIGLAGSLGGLGVYSIGQRISNIGFVLSSALQNVWGPVVYKEMFKKNHTSGVIIGNYLSPFYFFTVLIFLSISMFSEELIYILTTPEFSDASYIVSITTILYCGYFFNKQNQLIFNKKTALISLLTFIGIGLNMIFNYVFVHKWGFIGVAWGTTLSGLISAYIFFYFSQKSFKIVWKKNTGLLFYYLIFSSILMIFLNYIDTVYVFRLILKSFLIILFILLGLKFQFIKIEDAKNLIRKFYN